MWASFRLTITFIELTICGYLTKFFKNLYQFSEMVGGTKVSTYHSAKPCGGDLNNTHMRGRFPGATILMVVSTNSEHLFKAKMRGREKSCYDRYWLSDEAGQFVSPNEVS